MVLAHKSAASRIAALSLLVALCSLVGVGVGLPLFSEYRLVLAKIEHYRATLDGYERVARRETALRRWIESLKQNQSLEGLLLAAGSDSSATAAMQNRLQSIISDAGAWLTSVQALPAVPGDGHRRIGLRVQFVADINALRNILYGLEYGRPAIVLDNLFVHARSSRAIGVVDPLDVRIDMFAFKPEDA